MSHKCFFFAGGGTGGHLYPAIAVAEKIIELEPSARIHFFCSNRDIDSYILDQSKFLYTALPAKGFSLRLGELMSFCTTFLESYRIASGEFKEKNKAVVIGVGGFAAAPVCFAGNKLNMPVKLLNVDIVPGRANKIIRYWADEVFVQFEETCQYFSKRKLKVNVVGYPLRKGFEDARGDMVISELGLDVNKKILLVTGASSGAMSINETVCALLGNLNAFAAGWQIVHLTGKNNYEQVKAEYADAKISHKVLGYCDDMAGLLSAADLVIGRSGAGSVAEYAAGAVASICMPYPHHKDMHQYLNAGKLVEAGAGIIVDDLPDENERREWLWEELEALMKDDARREEMKANCKTIGKKDAALKIAERLLEI